jgi:hypothetical protein
VIADAETRKALPTVTLDFTEADVPGGEGIAGAAVVGAQGSLVVLAINPGPTMVVDLATRKVLWKNASVEPYALLGDTVMAATFSGETEARGLALRDGTTRWAVLPKSHGIDIAAIGPQRAVVIGMEYSSGDLFYGLIDANGKLTGLDRNAPKEREDDVTCQYDGVSVAVCTFGRSTSERFVVAYDSAGGQELWKLPDAAARRTAPTVTAVWHGHVYGQANAGPVILDARTGKDKAVPHIVPVAVNAQAAVAKPATTKDPIQVYRVTG